VPYGNPRPYVTLVVGGPKGRRIAPKHSDRAKVQSSRPCSATRESGGKIILIVTSGHLNGVKYQVGYARRRSGRQAPRLDRV